MRDIMDSVKSSHYHVACTRVFEVTHGLKKGEGLGGKLVGENVSHPNAYTERSREIERERSGAVEGVEAGGGGGPVEMAYRDGGIGTPRASDPRWRKIFQHGAPGQRVCMNTGMTRSPYTPRVGISTWHSSAFEMALVSLVNHSGKEPSLRVTRAALRTALLTLRGTGRIQASYFTPGAVCHVEGCRMKADMPVGYALRAYPL